MKNLITSIIVVAILVGGASFYGGLKYGENKTQTDRQQRFQDLGISSGPRNGGQRRGGGFVSGEIISKDDKSVTVKLRDGGSKIVFFSDSTEITKSVTGSLTDLEVGKNVMTNGTANSDGSVTAQTIQIRPVMPQPAQ